MAKPRLYLWEDQTADLLAAALVHPLHMHKVPSLDVIGPAMRKHCPVPGDTYDKLMTVLLEPGQGIDDHAHQRHTVLFYPAGLSVEPVIILPDGPYRPEPGEVLHLPPGTVHSVPAPRSRRLTVAMLVAEHRQDTKKAA